MRLLYTLGVLSAVNANSKPNMNLIEAQRYLEQAYAIAQTIPLRLGWHFQRQISEVLATYDIHYAFEYMNLMNRFYKQKDINNRPFYSRSNLIMAHENFLFNGDEISHTEIRSHYNQLMVLINKYPYATPVRADFFKLRVNYNYFKALKKTDSALIYCDSIIYSEYNYGNDKTNLYDFKHRALSETGDWKESYKTALLLMHIRDSVSNLNSRKELARLRVHYELNMAQNESERRKRQLFIYTGILFFLLFLLGCVILYAHKIRKTNFFLFEKLNQYTLHIAERKNGEHTPPQSADTNSASEVEPDTSLNISKDRKDEELKAIFDKLDYYVRYDQKYADHFLNREVLTSYLGVNRNKLSEAVSLATGLTIADYITHVRLEEALILMKENRILSLSEIADQCGFNVYSTFYRSFFKRYGVKPTEYKKYLTKQ